MRASDQQRADHHCHGFQARASYRLAKEATIFYLSVNSARLELPVKDYRNTFYELNRLLAEQARRDQPRGLAEAAPCQDS